MCCFSRPVKSVTSTNIFARSAQKERQFLVYEMKLAADEDLAMILPLPVPAKSAEDAVRFVSLEDYPEFFKDLAAGFPAPESKSRGDGAPALGKAEKPLAVVEVGAFEASFVPTVDDFSRLDKRTSLTRSSSFVRTVAISFENSFSFSLRSFSSPKSATPLKPPVSA